MAASIASLELGSVLRLHQKLIMPAFQA